MNKSQIQALMMRKNQQSTQADLLSISALMAEVLAEVADRLSEDEFYRLIGIGAAVYNHGLEQFRDETEDDDIETSEDEDPAYDLGQRHSGFRGRQ